MKAAMAVLDKQGEKAIQAILNTFNSPFPKKFEKFGIGTAFSNVIEKDVDSLQRQRIDSSIGIGFALSKLIPHGKNQFLKLDGATLLFDGIIYSPTQTIIEERFKKKLQQTDWEKAAKALLKEADGDFSFIIAEPERIIAGRDAIGVQPLYYGENKTFAALASNRTILWRLGIKNTNSFPPGHLACINQKGFRFEAIKTFVYGEPKPVTIQKGVKTLQKSLERSVRERVAKNKDVAVAFSGGIDSSLVALLAKKCQINVHLIHVCMENRSEAIEAKKAADDLNLPIEIYHFGETRFEKDVATVLKLIEEYNPVKVGVGLAFYWIAEKAAARDLRLLLSGQGADELFGGYQRHVKTYLLYGEEKTRKTMFNEVIELHKNNIERDVKVCDFHDVELRLPFASYRISKFALELPIEFKIERNSLTLRKLLMRKVAKKMGMPSSIVTKPKKAVQYSTGINYTLKKLAKKHKTTVTDYLNRLFYSQSKN